MYTSYKYIRHTSQSQCLYLNETVFLEWDVYVAISFYPSPLCFDASTNIYLEGMKENTASFYVCTFIKGGEIII